MKFAWTTAPIIFCCAFTFLVYVYIFYYKGFENTVPIYHDGDQPLQNKIDVKKWESHAKCPSQKTCKDICEALPRHLSMNEENLTQSGNLNWDKTQLLSLNLSDVTNANKPHVFGGSWAFRDPQLLSHDACDVNFTTSVAVIIPMRDRWYQVPGLLHSILTLLRKQKLCYRIFIVEQADAGPFNRGKLLNVGFVEAVKRFQSRCVIFHDVDQVPINDLIPYGCDEQTMTSAVHLGVTVDSNNFMLAYAGFIGRVIKISNAHFLAINGFSNLYWDWGGEDDDMERRLRAKKIPYVHIDQSIARYIALKHVMQPRRKNTLHYRLLITVKMRMTVDGLNSLNYDVLSYTETPLYTHILVNISDFTQNLSR